MDKELIDQIKNTLAAHEEAYTDGAWERFSAKEKKKPFLFYWPLWSAACVAFVIASLLYFNNGEKNETILGKKVPTEIAKRATKENATKINSEVSKSVSINPKKNESAIKKTAILAENKWSETKTDENLKKSSNNDFKTDSTIIGKSKISLALSSAQSAIEVGQFNKSTYIENKKTTKLTFEQLLAKDAEQNKLAKMNNTKTVIDKWHQDIFVAPAMGNDSKLNMNYGFSLSYNVAKKLSISSGLAYTALSTKREAGVATLPQNNAPVGISALATSTKNLESVDAQLSGINIPIELKYKISDKLYTGVGISAFAMIKNKQENNYLVSETKNTTAISTLGVAQRAIAVVTERVSEKQTETEVINDKYLGFYNFSLGYKQKISTNNHIAIEPFLSVPMKGFSKQNLNFTNGGLRVKFEF